jgi:glycosyltransferase involved in cell wall biosynthesis
MKILYDHQIFSFQEYGGVSRYFFELSEHLSQLENVQLKFSMLFSNNEYIRDNPVIRSIPFFSGNKSAVKKKLIWKFNQALSSAAVVIGNYDIFHPTYYHPYYLKLPVRKPTVLTCHDLIQEKFIKEEAATLKIKKQSLTNASKIIAISENTKRDLMDYYAIPESKIDVVYLASSFANVGGEAGESGNGEDYLLFVGNRDGYKNFSLMLYALAPLLRGRTSAYLYCCGGGGFKAEEVRLARELKIIDKLRYFGASNEQLQALYKGAIALIYPSLYEGFGIPILEAMSCGCPVITSNVSSLPEVGGKAALYFDPTDKDSIYHAAETIMNAGSTRSALIDEGYRQNAKFTWNKTAGETYNVYKKLL